MKRVELRATVARPSRRTTGGGVLNRLAKLSVLHLSCIVIAVGIFASPLVYVLMQAFKTTSEFTFNKFGLPDPLTLATFRAAWDQGDFGRQLINSTIYAIVPDVISLVLGVFLAFPIARGYFRHSSLLYVFFIFQGFVPPAIIPLFLETKSLHLYNNLIGYVIVNSLYGAGFFFFVGYLRGIPREREEAAGLDGCGYVRFIFTIIMPEMKPALAAFAVFGFVVQWNSLILPLILLPNPSLYPVTRGLFGFFSEYTSQWPLLCAATVIVSIPVILVFILLQRHLVEGIAGGAAGGKPGTL